MKDFFALLAVLLLVFPGFSQENEYKIGVIDLMLLKRQKLSAIPLAAELDADGLEVDMGGLGNRPTFESKLGEDSVRQQFLKAAESSGVEIFCLSMSGYYAQSFCGREEYLRSVEDCVRTMKAMNVKLGFLPLGVRCDLFENPDLRPAVVSRLKEAGVLAEKEGVVIAIETSLPAQEEIKLLQEIGSPAIRIAFKFSNPLKRNRNLYNELKTLGKENIALIHASNTDGVLLQDDEEIDLYRIKDILDGMGWKGWLVIERSRDATQPKNVRYNYGSNVAYLKKIFQ